jgi:chromosome partitioning protein
VTAKIITVANQKGGAGKSTLAMTLAGEFAQRSLRVLVVDTDPQGSAMRWAAQAPDEKPFPAAVIGLPHAGSKVAREVKPHVDNYDVILIDCPPAVDSPVPASAMLVSDLALIPVPCSPADLFASKPFKALVDQAQNLNETLVAYVVPNRYEHTRVANEVLEVLSDIGLPLTKTRLSKRAAFQEAMLEGCTLADLGSAARDAAEEIRALTDEVESFLIGGQAAKSA